MSAISLILAVFSMMLSVAAMLFTLWSIWRTKAIREQLTLLYAMVVNEALIQEMEVSSELERFYDQRLKTFTATEGELLLHAREVSLLAARFLNYSLDDDAA